MLLPRAHASALSALLLAALLLGVTAPVSAEETDAAREEQRSAAFVFPDVRVINPTQTEYVVEVSDNDYDKLRASWQGHRTTLAADGPSTVALPVDGVGKVLVEGCVERSCSEIAQSPRLKVLRELHVSWGGTVRVDEGAVDVVADFELQPPVTDGYATWQIPTVDDPGAPLASGRARFRSGYLYHDTLEFTVQVPPGLPEGEHLLTADLSASHASYGRLEGAVVGTVVVDREAPVIGALTLSRDTLYPPRDKYLDTTKVQAAVQADARRGSFVVEDADGEVVSGGRLQRRGDADLMVGTWTGERSYGKSLPTGDYSVRAQVWDEAGNQSEPVRTTVSVVAQRTVQRRFDLRMRPQDMELRRWVGRCSRLKSPSSRRVRGSIGLFSQLRCGRKGEGDVSTANGVYLPPSVDARYRKLQLRITGGRSQRHRNGALAYLVAHLEDRDGDFVNRKQLGRRYREWRLDKAGNEVVHDRKSERPYVIWHVGLTQGSRYDVDEYRLRGFRSVLEDVPTD